MKTKLKKPNKMTQFEFTTICLKNMITPSLVWDLEAFKELVKNDQLNEANLQQVINENF